MRAPIHSKKHYVQKSLSTILAGVVDTEVIIDGEPIASVNTVSEVVEGALVKAIFVERWIRTADTAGGSFIAIICKHAAGVNDPTAAEMAALGNWDNKKNIIYTTQGLSNDQDADAIPFLRQWFKIPRGKQRTGLGDTWRIHVFAQTLDHQHCGFTTYKEYT